MELRLAVLVQVIPLLIIAVGVNLMAVVEVQGEVQVLVVLHLYVIAPVSGFVELVLGDHMAAVLGLGHVVGLVLPLEGRLELFGGLDVDSPQPVQEINNAPLYTD